MLPIPKQAGEPGIVTGEDVRAIVKMQGLAEIGPGDCAALHTGQGNTWSNDRYMSTNSDQRKAARDLSRKGSQDRKCQQWAAGRLSRPKHEWNGSPVRTNQHSEG
jgi:hypothetical protein